MGIPAHRRVLGTIALTGAVVGLRRGRRVRWGRALLGANAACFVDGGSTRVLAANDAARAITGDRDPVGRALADLVDLDADGLATLWTERPVDATVGAQQRRCQVRAVPAGRGRWRVDVVDVEDERAAQDRLARQVEVLSDVAGQLAHDLRTPLTSIAGFASVLAKAPDAPVDQRTDWAERMARSARQLADYIRDMANAARTTTSAATTDVAAAVERAVALNDAQLREVAATVRVAAEPGLDAAIPELVLRQILHNLLINAIKYRNRAVDLALDIDAAVVDDVVEIRVTDNGPGIATTERQAVFDLGARSATSAGVEGDGLGLARCRQLVEDVGGSLRVEDAPDGTGARFVLRIPVDRSRPAVPVPRAMDDTASAPGLADLLARVAPHRPDEVLIRHPNGTPVLVSPPDGVVARLLGGSGASGERLHADDVAAVIDTFQAAQTDPGSAHEVAARFREDDGTYTTLHLTVVDPPDRAELGGFVVSVRPTVIGGATQTSIVDQLGFPALLVGHRRQLITANVAAREALGWVDALPHHAWTDALPDWWLRTSAKAALEDRRFTMLDATDGPVGAVIPLHAPSATGESFLVLLWGLADQRAATTDDSAPSLDPA